MSVSFIHFYFIGYDMLFCLIIVQSNARNRIFMTLYAYKGSIIILQAQLIAYNLAFFSSHHETVQKARIHTAGTSVRTDTLLMI